MVLLRIAKYAYRPGDTISLEVTALRDCNLMLVSLDPRGGPMILSPKRFHRKLPPELVPRSQCRRPTPIRSPARRLCRASVRLLPAQPHRIVLPDHSISAAMNSSPERVRTASSGTWGAAGVVSLAGCRGDGGIPGDSMNLWNSQRRQGSR
jgi:hypothetical protein